MKYEYLTLMAVLIVLFSLGTVGAGDNVTSDDVFLAEDDGSDFISDDLADESQDTSSDDGIDLSVKVSKAKDELENTTIVEVPFNVIASVSGGTAHNTKIHIYYGVDNDTSYFTHNQTMGTYDPATGLWDIGDLKSSDYACLTIVTKFNTHGKNLTSIGNLVVVNATTTSKDVNMSNNFLIQSVVYAAPIYYVEESDDKQGAQHNGHQASYSSNYSVVVLIDEPPKEANNTQKSKTGEQSNATSETKKDSGSKIRTDSGDDLQKGKDSKSDSKSVAKEIDQNMLSKTVSSLTASLSQVSGSLNDLITDIFNHDANPAEGSDDLSKSGEGMQAYDYTRIPLLVFSVFLIALAGFAGYSRFKS